MISMDFRLQSLRWTAIAAILLLLAVSADAAELRVKIEGLHGRDEGCRPGEPVPRGVRRSRPYTRPRSSVYFATGREEIRKSLEPFGYYNAKVSGELQDTAKGHEAVSTA